MSVFSLIPCGPSGGSAPDLSGITATSSEILAGYQSVDRFGEPVYGDIYPANDEVTFASVCDLPGPEVLEVSVPVTGYYMTNGYGLWLDYSAVARAIGLTAAKLKTGVTVLGITGT
ncbi:MAG: hypothetical protein IKZ81_05255 [Clostridia bacterium]|nr:hypothetical protein [Clostridia bacterium]MBR5768828.1 hypothetical protein [Clostridia bacterium]MBR5942733.1 hypothetical protein [Clostridia bacterium]